MLPSGHLWQAEPWALADTRDTDLSPNPLRLAQGAVVGLTCRVGRAVSGHVDMVQDLLADNHSLLFLGRPGAWHWPVVAPLHRKITGRPFFTRLVPLLV